MRKAYKDIVGMHIISVQDRGRRFDFKEIWEARAPLKAKLMVWRLWKTITTKDNLEKRGSIDNQNLKCCRCKVDDESVLHFFFKCPKMEKFGG